MTATGTLPAQRGGAEPDALDWGVVVPPRRPRRYAPPAVRVVSTAITLMSVTLLVFAVYIGFLGRLHHDREQLTAYANFRKDLANAVAPTGQGEPTEPKKLLPLGSPVAVLEIPKLGLREVVFEGTSGGVLEKGPGHLRTTPQPGQAGVSEIMGRANLYGGPFNKLYTLLPDDTFTVTTARGVQKFKVLDVRHAGLPQPPPPASGTGRLVLATAYGGPFVPSDVLRVDAELTSPVQPSAKRLISQSQLPHAEQALAIDGAAWFPMVFVGEALVIVVALVSLARTYWGRWQAWTVAIPLVAFFGLATADQAARLLPNLM